MNDNTQRIEQFRAEVADMKLRDPATGLDRLLVRLGVVGLVTGLCFGALLGLTIAVVGGALFVKGAMAGFLRFWMARLCYEQQVQADRIAASLAPANGNGRDHDERTAVG